MYKLPLGLQIPDRIPDRIDYPSGDDYDTIQQKRARANIVEGYKMREIEVESFSILPKSILMLIEFGTCL